MSRNLLKNQQTFEIPWRIDRYLKFPELLIDTWNSPNYWPTHEIRWTINRLLKFPERSKETRNFLKNQQTSEIPSMIYRHQKLLEQLTDTCSKCHQFNATTYLPFCPIIFNHLWNNFIHPSRLFLRMKSIAKTLLFLFQSNYYQYLFGLV